MKQKFYEYNTYKKYFYNNGVDPIETDTMTKTSIFKYSEHNDLDSKVLEVDYIGNKISFVIVLPNERNGLNSLKQMINAKSFDRAIKSMQLWYVKVYLPKFTFEKSYDLMDEINHKPIALTKKADFSGLTSDPRIVCKIKHKVIVDFHEKGTEAAPVNSTSFNEDLTGSFESELEFIADHPFLYFIRDKTNGIILFSGQINKF